MQIRELSVRGFRRLESVVDVELRSLTVVLGANASGKTSLLDALRLLSRSAAGAARATLNELGGIESLLTRGRAKSLHLLARSTPEPTRPNAPDAPYVYSLQIDSYRQAYLLGEETLYQQVLPPPAEPFSHLRVRLPQVYYGDLDKMTWTQPDWNYDPFETALSQVPKAFRRCDAFKQHLASLTSYAARDIPMGQRAPVRSPQSMRPADLPGAAGEELIPYLYYLRETDHNRFEMVTDALSAAFPSFERLDFPPVAAGTLTVTWKDREYAQPIYAHELSDGTLRFLWLVALLASPALPAMTLIDEPEVSLHPTMLMVLSDLLREAAARTQLIVATHSESLVRFLRPEEILVLDIEDGRAVAKWADTLDLEQWLKDYTMDELWRMNRLGGNP